MVPNNMDALEWLRKHLDAEGSDLLREMVRTFVATSGGNRRIAQRPGLVESRMRGNTHVRFGSAGRGNGPPETAAPRPGPTLTGAPRAD